MLVTCAYLVEPARPWVMQSLFLTAIGEARDRGAARVEAFAYRYPEGGSACERFHEHKTVFPRDFLATSASETVRSPGRVELVRLELGGLQPVREGTRDKVIRAASRKRSSRRRCRRRPARARRNGDCAAGALLVPMRRPVVPA